MSTRISNAVTSCTILFIAIDFDELVLTSIRDIEISVPLDYLMKARAWLRLQWLVTQQSLACGKAPYFSILGVPELQGNNLLLVDNLCSVPLYAFPLLHAHFQNIHALGAVRSRSVRNTISLVSIPEALETQRE